MSQPDDKNAKIRRPIVASAMDSMPDRFQSSVSISDVNKPDSRNLHLGSPISPLGNRPTSTAVTNTSSSSSSSGSVTGRTGSNVPSRKKYDGKSHSGEITRSGDSRPTSVDSPGTLGQRNSKPGHRRSGSGQLVFSGGGGSSATSPNTNVLPAGNICPSGKIAKTGMMSRSSPRSDVLGSGTGNYGHGSIIRGSAAITRPPGEVPQSENSPEKANTAAVKKAMSSRDPEEVKKIGNEQYRKGNLSDALKLYDRAILLCPSNPTCHSNRAAALIALGRLPEAVRECEEALRLDPAFIRAHHRLASLYIRSGLLESAKKHISASGKDADQAQLQKVQAIEKHLKSSGAVRKISDWPSVIRESEAAIAAGADYSAMLLASKAEAHLHLSQPEEAESLMAKASKMELTFPAASLNSYSGILAHAYVYFVQALVDMTLGSFDSAISWAERAARADPRNLEMSAAYGNVRGVIRARSRGSELFKSEMFAEACTAYGEGLKFDPRNPVLRCNRAVCFSKLGEWEKSVRECNEALKVHPNHTKALHRRAASYWKLEKWADAVADYERLRKLLPADKEVAESYFHAQVALKKSRGEEVSNLSFGGEVEKISGVEHLHDAISMPGVVLVHFMSSGNEPCRLIAQFVDSLCSKYPFVNFLRVDIDESPELAKSENVIIVPAFKFFRQGIKLKEMVCPTRQMLENTVRHYSG